MLRTCSSVLEVSHHGADQVSVKPAFEAVPQQKFFVVATLLANGILFGSAVLARHLLAFFAMTVALFAVMAFSGVTHDLAADGVYKSEPSDRRPSTSAGRGRSVTSLS